MLAQTMLITNAHRMSDNEVDASVTNIYAGQLFQLNAQGKWVYADGTKKAYPTLNDRFPGLGLGSQGERLEGRDNVSRSKKLSVLKGNFEIGTDQYDTAVTYTYGAPLMASTDPAKKGKVTLFDPALAGNATKFHLIIGYVTKVPASASDFLRYEG
jgi:hypothetical protein